ncbi:MAG: TRAM domain-containing protein, partial [Vampirovibrionia bacterium]
FNDTIKAVEDMVFDQCNTAMYSPRKRTPAATWKDKQLTKEIKKERINILNDYVKKSAFKSNEKMLNSTQEILIESFSETDNETILCGRTRNNKITHLKGDKSLVGELVKVKITDITAWSIRGEIIKETISANI